MNQKYELVQQPSTSIFSFASQAQQASRSVFSVIRQGSTAFSSLLTRTVHLFNKAFRGGAKTRPLQDNKKGQFITQSQAVAVSQPTESIPHLIGAQPKFRLRRQDSTHAKLLASPQFAQQSPVAVADEVIDKMRAGNVMIPPGLDGFIRKGLLILTSASLVTKAAAHHTMTAGVTVLGPDKITYLYEFDPTFPELVAVGQAFLNGTCGMTPTVLNQTEKVAQLMTVLSHTSDGMWNFFLWLNRILPEDTIAGLASLVPSNGTESVKACMVREVQPVVSAINNNQLAVTLGIGIPSLLLVVGLIGLGIYACVRCCCRHNQYAPAPGGLAVPLAPLPGNPGDDDADERRGLSLGNGGNDDLL